MCINIGVIVISVKNALIDPVTLTFQPQNNIICRYLKVIPYRAYTKFEHFGIILSYAPDKQTNKQTANIHPRQPTLSAWIMTLSYLWTSLKVINIVHFSFKSNISKTSTVNMGLIIAGQTYFHLGLYYVSSDQWTERAQWLIMTKETKG